MIWQTLLTLTAPPPLHTSVVTLLERITSSIVSAALAAMPAPPPEVRLPPLMVSPRMVVGPDGDVEHAHRVVAVHGE